MAAVFFLVGVLAFVGVQEVRSSTLQARVFSVLARAATFRLGRGPSPSIVFPVSGPYDDRLGYSRLPDVSTRLLEAGFEIEAQARFSPILRSLALRGVFPTYREKTRAGLEILDRDGETLFAARFPESGYERFEDVPPPVWQTLLFIENRELLDPRYPTRNPAVEWDRLAKATFELALRTVAPAEGNTPGGSTLATQLEKFRHSPGGATASPTDKLRQMLSATLRSYQSGEDTLAARRWIVTDYLNSMPLAAVPGYGEVFGLAAGLDAYYGADFDEVSRLLTTGASRWGTPAPLAAAVAYRRVVSLLLAQRRPSYYLGADTESLESLTDRYLPLLAAADIVSGEIRDRALAARPTFQRRRESAPPAPLWLRKTTNAVRNRLTSSFGLASLYDLDRFDLTVEATLDHGANERVTQHLAALADPARVAAEGLGGERMLAKGDPSKVVYSFTLYERVPGMNVLRVQTDSVDQPLDLNEGVKLDLGSTAKLRTLVTYLDVIAGEYERLLPLAEDERARDPLLARDPLMRWVVETLRAKPAITLEELLAAALERKYSANPGESFFTGGGLHTFHNFDDSDDGRFFTVTAALASSVNLVFVRMMRDIVSHYVWRVPGAAALSPPGVPRPVAAGEAATPPPADPAETLRTEYLRRFADREGRTYLERFWRAYRDKTAPELLEQVLRGVRLKPTRFAMIYRAIEPQAPRTAFEAELRVRFPESALTPEDVDDLYAKYDPERWNLADQGYIATVHPLALWLAGFLRATPDATWQQVVRASEEERLEVYSWLFKTSRRGAQDRRIRNLIEIEAFLEIGKEWQKYGYPFETLVPSLASSIGSSADRPAALAELVGILLGDGVRYPTTRMTRLQFGAGTPYETIFVRKPTEGERVTRPEVARAVRKAMLGVVENGTARRIAGAYVLANGEVLPIGGKTGTGDHRHKVYGPGRALRESRAVNRTATFVFYLGDRFYGVITAFVPGSDAGDYAFTSSVPVQILKNLAPELAPLLARGYAPPAAAAAPPSAAAPASSAPPKPVTAAPPPAPAPAAPEAAEPPDA